MSDSPGIPTTYSGVNMRSRFEARVAILLDALGLEWHYEPVDLRNYIPDFLVTTKFQRDYRSEYDRVIFEARPEFDMVAAIDKISRSGWEHAACVVVDSPGFARHASGGWVLGYATDRVCEADAGRGSWRAANWHPFGICAESKQLVWGGGDDLTDMWRTAGNRSQWQPSPSRT